MVFSAMSASDAEKKNTKDAHKWAMTSAVISGVAVLILIISLFVTIYYGSQISAATTKVLGGVHRMTSPYASTSV